ncbi:hypothetical protein [Brevibacillus nitrificans]|uniref:hypothetical protein n=1 Tax=Brevibacillus TaxID=55080 RepID=UPI0028542AE2|nr:hypothetical protein [Brevibacillus nitrificans]MDR7314468.1 hypothetical protein [Brevibacillus nitrificans]
MKKRMAVQKLVVFIRFQWLFQSFKAGMPTTAGKEKGEISEGIRDTAEAKWKKRNKLERPTLIKLPEKAAFGRRSVFGM